MPVFTRCTVGVMLLVVLNFARLCTEYIQSVTGGMDHTLGECSLGHTIPI